MITDDTRIDLPGLISPTRTPWSGTFAEAMRYDGDTVSPRIFSLCETWGVPTEDENGDGRDDLDMLADLAEAGADDTAVVRDLFDDPNAEVRAPERHEYTNDDVRSWLGPDEPETTDEQVESIRRAWQALPQRFADDDNPAGSLEATNGAAAYVLEGPGEFASAKTKWTDAQLAASEAEDYLVGVIVAALEAGETKAAIAQRLGISRPRLDRWLA